MSHQKDGLKEWHGEQQLDHFPSLVVQTLRVTNERGRSCFGSLAVFDSTFNKKRQFLWQATYGGERRWVVTGREASALSIVDYFDQNNGVNFDMIQFVRGRLNAMVKEGKIFRPQDKTVASDQPKQPAPALPAPPAASVNLSPPPPPPPPPPPEPGPAASVASAATLSGVANLASSMVVVRIPVNRIRPNPEQPRRYFRKYTLRQLAASMKTHDQRQLVEVVQVRDDPKADFELITGERRWRAAKIGGITHLNAIVKDRQEVPDRKRQNLLCLVADFHHEGYSKLETALALIREKENGASVAELRKICGRRSDAWVYQHLALNDLVPELKSRLDPNLPRSRQLSFTIGCRIARIPKERQMEVYRQVSQVVGHQFQLMAVNKLVAEMVPNKPAGRPRKLADYVKSLRCIVPRAAADALTADKFSNRVFGSLVENTGAEAVKTMLNQINMAIQGFNSLKGKILVAQKRCPEKQV